jgi:hypothetical protein
MLNYVTKLDNNCLLTAVKLALIYLAAESLAAGGANASSNAGQGCQMVCFQTKKSKFG